MGTYGNCFQDKHALSLGHKKPLKESKAQLPYLGNAHLSLGPFKVCIYILQKKLWAFQRHHDTNAFTLVETVLYLCHQVFIKVYILFKCFHKSSVENLTTKFILSICSLIKFKDD